MSVAELQKAVNDYYTAIQNAGKARRAKVQGDVVIVDGVPYPHDCAVPITVKGDVYVHINGNRAVIIGGA